MIDKLFLLSDLADAGHLRYGLGLHTGPRIAEQHHGRLWLESSSDAGSVFVLALPLAEDGPTRQ